MIKHWANLRTSGTIMPSSRFLVNRLLAGIDFADARVIVELGVGTGCVTREILRRMRADARLVSLEINPAFLDVARRIGDPRLTLRNACAGDLLRVLGEEGVDDVDAVVSSLPLRIMDQALVDRVLDASRACLHPDGRFHQYQYSLSHYAKLAERYAEVDIGFTVRNAPPAFVYTCTGATRAAPGEVRLRPSVAAVYAGALAAATMVIRAVHDI
ncbi:MAG: methyltransferase domain-containing protein [Gemmatimonadota bacterium]|nr:methyltransferase domain-containing protein [Gemmatimonadota bacterium]MDE3127003.1 methyltransferase domain-containing protein [Gemmatimonadota bacterium]MDE3174261.1 methyltransferase domain-containing protein [Gemmatimonadota bacterium]MDE3216878.1 methyltransferase domain-containing protein [Gemmatimonadota bacterium]